MTAVISVCLETGEKLASNRPVLCCLVHMEKLRGEPDVGSWKSEDCVQSIIHDLCDPQPGDDPTKVRIMRRGTVDKSVLEWFRIFITPCKTPFGICFVTEHQRMEGCPSEVSARAMEVYEDVCRWAKVAHKVRRPFCELPPHRRAAIVRNWHKRIFPGAAPEYVAEEPEEPVATRGTDELLAELLASKE